MNLHEIEHPDEKLARAVQVGLRRAGHTRAVVRTRNDHNAPVEFQLWPDDFAFWTRMTRGAADSWAKGQLG